MLDEKDLQAIAALMSEQIGASEARMMEQIDASQSRMMEQIRASESRMMIMMESYFDPKFKRLADGLELLKEKTIRREELEETSDRLDVLEAVVKLHSREIEKLKKAQ